MYLSTLARTMTQPMSISFRTMFSSLLGLGAIAPLLVLFHTHLVKAEPGIDATVAEAPTQIRLWFNERPEVSLSGATLVKADNSPVASIKMRATDDTLSVAGPVSVALEPGNYLVLWRTASRDGHAVRGKYAFTFAPATPAVGAKP